ncbi:MAG: hypothetical protein JXA10_17675 [Anaerolineae bacterium]|nr:hypothetical protein [Anaerolineae bacterium]
MADRLLVWTPRGVAVIYILMMSLFALDVEDESFVRAVLGFVIHLIPALILLGCTVLAWRNPRAGGIAFLVLGVGFTWFFHTYEDVAAFIILSVPLFVAGVLFLKQSQ